jgi:hypothetical protein
MASEGVKMQINSTSHRIKELLCFFFGCLAIIIGVLILVVPIIWALVQIAYWIVSFFSG